MYADSALSLVVPVVTILLVFLTRRVALSLFCGIVLAGIMLNFNSLQETPFYVYDKISSVFYDYKEGFEINWQSVYVFGFLFVLGILTQLISYSGGISAFVKWARKKINTPKGSEFLALLAGIVIFIDDYFNALTVGQISKSLNDANHSTRERLAYIIDSTSAPVCILMPISSWGAYILVQLNKNFENNDNFLLLFSTIWGNYYAWLALLGVFLTILWQINLPSMRKNRNVGVNEDLEINLQTNGNVWLLLIPVLALIGFVGGLIFLTGYINGGRGLVGMLGETDTGFSLFWGGFAALVVSWILSIKHICIKDYLPIIKSGISSMVGACLILILAWAIGPIIKDDLSTGQYLANIGKIYLESSNINPHLAIVVVSFVTSCFIAFCTGTSWATFAIMIPIAGSLATANGVDMVLVISAVLSGAVYGDHASPISDTTILSATGAGCSVQSHFITQLPYVTTVAFVALVSFIVGSVLGVFSGFCAGVILLIGVFWIYKKMWGEA